LAVNNSNGGYVFSDGYYGTSDTIETLLLTTADNIEARHYQEIYDTARDGGYYDN